MIDVLSQATHNFIQHQLRLTSQDETLFDVSQCFHANITLTHQGQDKSADFYYANDFVQLISLALLGEKSENPEDLQDLIEEITNQIAGSAKTLQPDSFDIGLPNYKGETSQVPNNGTYRAFSIDNKMMLSIALT